MCNLSKGIREDAMKKGIEEGIEKGIEKGIEIGEASTEKRIILNMYNHGDSLEVIAKSIGKDIDIVKAIIEGKELLTV